MNGEECEKHLVEKGYRLKEHEDESWRSIERYAFPRNNTPDFDGNVIVDICYYLEGSEK